MVEAIAVSKALRPRLTTGCVGSSSTTVSINLGLLAVETSTKETVFSTAFNTQACVGLPSLALISATPRGVASTATRPSTSPVSASMVISLSEPAAETNSVESSPLILMP